MAVNTQKLFESIEIEKCGKSPAYFIETYCRIRHPMKGQIPFKLYEYQKVALDDYETYRKCIVLKSRQMGFSWLSAAYSLWKALFRNEQDILFMSKKESDAKEILHKVKFMHSHLPRWLSLKKLVDSAGQIGFANGSRIESLPATENAGRGFSGSLVIIDEASFIPWGEVVFGALRPTLSTGGSIILQSTAPNEGGENLFSRLYHDYEDNGFHRVVGPGEKSKERGMVHWSDNPDRGEKWYEEERPGYTDRQWATEMEGDFSQSSRRVFPEGILILTETERDKDDNVKKIEWKKGDLGELYNELPQPGEKYAVGVDVAEGLVKGDYTVAQVISKSNGKQVAILRTKEPIVNATEKIVELAEKYNTALLAIEDNAIGVAALQIAKRKYNNLYRRKVFDKKTNVWTEKLGWRTTKRSKPLAIRELELALRDRSIILTDPLTRRELWQYEYDDKGNTNAPKGAYFDDCVMSLAIAWQALEQVKKPITAEEKLEKRRKRRKKRMKRVRNSSIGY